ncbi:hypothetical protein [Arcobacter arenosus]|uniref:Uncharacterized protein n=1 Tax=Arcobacter arenosus TaxID=2576037 RepID=A0A5R8XYY9_9BACT|nr:hypothetical protein [Arcobacter arenosus]TLP36227.1 hypothetical protein FDK22_13230 [Arcobacter arenosus]
MKKKVSIKLKEKSQNTPIKRVVFRNKLESNSESMINIHTFNNYDSKVFSKDQLIKLQRIKNLVTKKINGRIRNSYKIQKDWIIDDSEISNIKK